MKNKPELSDEEIQSYMDFDRLMKSRKLITGTGKFYSLMKRIIPLIIISGIATWFALDQNKHRNQPVANKVEHSESPAEGPKQEQINSTNEVEQSGHEKVKEEEKSRSIKAPAKAAEIQQVPQQSQSVLQEDEYIQAEPTDGYTALYSYFNTQLVYPAESVKDSIQGVQTVSFVINAEGKPEKIQVKQSLGEPFEKEARRLIENMPLWKPASLNGKPVPSQMSLPLTFQIQKVKSK